METSVHGERAVCTARGAGRCGDCFLPINRSLFHATSLQVRIAKQLTLDGSIKPQSIAILSPYNAQVSEINKRLAREGIRDMTVCSIMKSQGKGSREWMLSPPPQLGKRDCPSPHHAE